jgi:polyisoprenoid-binding protein YceI
MFNHKVLLAVAGVLVLVVLAFGGPSTPSFSPGSWQVDTRHSDAQLITDGTTNFGKTKINFTLGYARVSGEVKVDDNDPAKSSVEFHIYPATSMGPPIEEDGNFKMKWLENLANNTLICFHSKKVVKMPDGKLQATGELTLTRVDRNVEVNPNEAYRGPVYGPPMTHHVSREATFELEDASGKITGQKGGLVAASGSTNITREQFPEMMKAVVTTYWPPVVQDAKCQTPANVSEDYRGTQCTGTFMESSGLPQAPIQVGEDYPAASNYSAVVGSQLTILVHLRLGPRAGGAQAAGGE